jgi:hypothetical protein
MITLGDIIVPQLRPAPDSTVSGGAGKPTPHIDRCGARRPSQIAFEVTRAISITDIRCDDSISEVRAAVSAEQLESAFGHLWHRQDG